MTETTNPQRPAEGWRLVPADLLERLLGGDPTVYPLLAPYAAAPPPPAPDEGMVEAMARAHENALWSPGRWEAIPQQARDHYAAAMRAALAALPPAPLPPAGQAEPPITTFEAHTAAVGRFLGELYAVMVDPCAEGTITVEQAKNEIMAAALLQREKSGQAEPAGWQPIASAPLDGTRVLLWSDVLDPHTIQGQWRDYCWVDVWNNDPIELGSGAFVEFTHWQPLPSPPSEPGQ